MNFIDSKDALLNIELNERSQYKFNTNMLEEAGAEKKNKILIFNMKYIEVCSNRNVLIEMFFFCVCSNGLSKKHIKMF